TPRFPPGRAAPGGMCPSPRWPRARRCAAPMPPMQKRRGVAKRSDDLPLLSRQGSPMTVKLGINPIGWTNDCMHWLGDFITLERCLSEVKEAEFSGVELGRKFPRQVARLGPILQEHGLSLVSGWYSAQLVTRDAKAEIAAMRDHLDLLAGL